MYSLKVFIYMYIFIDATTTVLLLLRNTTEPMELS